MKNLLIWLTFFLLFSFSAAHSAVIVKIKGRKALVDLEGVPAAKGDKFDALNLYGKPLGVLEIKKVKKGKAIAVLLKGKMGMNWILEPSAQETGAFNTEDEDEYDPARRDSISDSSSSVDSDISSKGSPFSSNGFGLMLGANFNTITISANKSVAGWGFQEALNIDFSLVGPLGLRLLLGHQTLIATGSNCGLPRCSLLIHYPGAGLILRGVFLRHLMFQPWVGAGGFMFWPLVDKQHDLGFDKKSFSSFHGSVTAAVGVDIRFGGFYLPVQLDASWINPITISIQSLKEGSKEFKPLYIGLKVGIAFSF